MTAVEALNKARDLHLDIYTKQSRLLTLRNLATGLHSVIGNATGGHSGSNDIQERAMDLEREIWDELDELLRHQEWLSNMIDQLSDAQERNVLYLYYLCKETVIDQTGAMHLSSDAVGRLFSWSEVADRVPCSESTVYRIRESAIAHLDYIIQLDSVCY